MALLLMIDDNPQSRRYVERIVQHRTSHKIAFAATSDEGIEKIVEQRPDLIFLDLFLPGMDGFELFDLLRNHPATENIPIIVHSPVPLDPITELRLKKVTCEGFLEFPIEASELNRVIDIALKRNEISVQKWVPPSV